MCRCGWTPKSELGGYEGPQVRAGSWERWGHFLPPGCLGCVGKEEACLLRPLHTPEANQTYIRLNQRFGFSENNGFLCMFLNWHHFSLNVYLLVITYRLIFQFEMKHRLSFFVISGDLRGLPYFLGIRDPNPSELKHKSFEQISLKL